MRSRSSSWTAGHPAILTFFKMLFLIRIDLNGQILISKLVESEQTQAIDLQWMVMACDPNSVERETCDDLPVRSRRKVGRKVVPSPAPSLRRGSRAR